MVVIIIEKKKHEMRTKGGFRQTYHEEAFGPESYSEDEQDGYCSELEDEQVRDS